MCITTSKNEQVDAFNIILMNAIWKHFFKKTFEQFIQVNRDLYTVLNKFSGFYSNDFISRKTTCLKKTPKAMFYIKRLLSGKKKYDKTKHLHVAYDGWAYEWNKIIHYFISKISRGS